VVVDGPKRDRLAYGANIASPASPPTTDDGGYREVVRAPSTSSPPSRSPTARCHGERDRRAGAARRPRPASGSPTASGRRPRRGWQRLDSYGGWWVTCLLDYLRYTGDAGFVRPLLPVARRMVGLLADHAGDGVLWPTTSTARLLDQLAPADRRPGSTPGERLLLRDAAALAALERELADDETAAAALERAPRR